MTMWGKFELTNTPFDLCKQLGIFRDDLLKNLFPIK